MEIAAWRRRYRGPFRADQIRDGDGYELTNGHPIFCPPPNPLRAGLRLAVAHMLQADPAVEWAATGLGFSPDLETLRGPDVMAWVRTEDPGAPGPPAPSERDRLRLSTALMLGTDPALGRVRTVAESLPGPRALGRDSAKEGSEDRGWVLEAPALAVEMADKDRDEEDLEQRIRDLIDGGVRLVWVARLVGPHRIEVHAPGQPVRRISKEADLTAPGILRRRVPALAFFDREVALQQVLRSQLERGE